tara:strand:+ start:10008 stop:10580 length:573 start_codon:yes stop_codon:yes gene_type:complete
MCIRHSVVLLGLLVAAPVAADYADGAAAFERGDWATAYREWKPLAEAGDPASQNNLGFLYRYGRGVPADVEQAVFWYRRAAIQGHAAAQFNLGLMLDNGLGAPQDFGRAALWFRRAADQGLARAQAFLGMMYWAGKGVPGDRAEALYWTWLAGDRGDPLAVRNRQIFEGESTSDVIDQARILSDQRRPGD